MGVVFEEDQVVIKPLFKLLGRKIKIPYEKIERIEMPPGDSVFFYMKNGKAIKVPDPGVVSFYTGFGEMLKKHKIPYKVLLEDSTYEAIETMREKAVRKREELLAYGNRSLQEKLGAEYELEGKIVERIIGITLEFRLLKNGVVQEEANQDESIDGIPLVDEMDLAVLSEWDPAFDLGKYTFIEEENEKAVSEEYMDDVVIDSILRSIGGVENR